MRITAKGQVTIPRELRERAGLMPGTDVQFRLDGNKVLLEKSRPGRRRTSRGQALVAGLRGKGSFGRATDEIIALMRGPAADDDAPPR